MDKILAQLLTVVLFSLVVIGKTLPLKEHSKHGVTDSAGNVIEVRPPDHLEGVKMEQDGHINEDFRKEVFLGHHEHIDSLSPAEQEEKLKEVFAKVDKDSNGELTLGEIGDWINAKIKEHFDDAKRESSELMRLLDTDKDGGISYKEYMVGYIRSLGHPGDKAAKYMEDYESLELSTDERDDMIRFRFRWAEAEEGPRDNILNEEEFLNFRHPEHSVTAMLNMVKDIVKTLDTNNDGRLTEEEFAQIPGEVEMPAGMEIDMTEENKYKADRKKEFKTYVDENGNGEVTKDELMNYLNPLHHNQGMNEGEKIIRECDQNRDFKVTMKELLDKKEYILGSKLVDVVHSFHDEF